MTRYRCDDDFRGAWDGKTALEHFADRVERDVNTGCWLWRGHIADDGYGHFRVWPGPREWRAHRFSYVAHVGPIPDEMMVCHRCDTPVCVNPNHLFVGSALDNATDCKEKGRVLAGAQNVRNRLRISAEDARAIREMRVAGSTYPAIAAAFGCSESHVRSIVAGRAWRNAGGPSSKRSPPEKRERVELYARPRSAAAWREAAESEGVSLSTWVHNAADAACGTADKQAATDR